MQLAQEHGITGWVADDRLLGPVRPLDLQWIGQHVLPQLVGLGLRRFARLDAVDPLNKMLIGQAQEAAELQLPFELRSFTDPAEARAWACGLAAGAVKACSAVARTAKFALQPSAAWVFCTFPEQNEKTAYSASTGPCCGSKAPRAPKKVGYEAKKVLHQPKKVLSLPKKVPHTPKKVVSLPKRSCYPQKRSGKYEKDIVRPKKGPVLG